MRRGYQLARWKRRAETLHRKATELAEEIMESEGEDADLTGFAQNLSCHAVELVTWIENERR